MNKNGQRACLQSGLASTLNSQSGQCISLPYRTVPAAETPSAGVAHSPQAIPYLGAPVIIKKYVLIHERNGLQNQIKRKDINFQKQ
jgi:hypothetical protein